MYPHHGSEVYFRIKKSTLFLTALVPTIPIPSTFSHVNLCRFATFKSINIHNNRADFCIHILN